MAGGGGNGVAPFNTPDAGVGVVTGAGMVGAAEDVDVEAIGVAGNPADEDGGGVLGLEDGGAGGGARGGIEGGGIETCGDVGEESDGMGAEVEGWGDGGTAGVAGVDAGGAGDAVVES